MEQSGERDQELVLVASTTQGQEERGNVTSIVTVAISALVSIAGGGT